MDCATVAIQLALLLCCRTSCEFAFSAIRRTDVDLLCDEPFPAALPPSNSSGILILAPGSLAILPFRAIFCDCFIRFDFGGSFAAYRVPRACDGRVIIATC